MVSARLNYPFLVVVLMLALLLSACGRATSGDQAAIAPEPRPANRNVQEESDEAPPAEMEMVTDEAMTGAPPPAEPTAAAEPAAAAVEVNPYTSTDADKLSTFALDVDTASYSAARNYLEDGALPPPDLLRVEEFVNYFDYDYAPPADEDFAIHLAASPAPFADPAVRIVRVGIQGRTIEVADRKPALLTFVIDVSGSMQQPDRLPLAKEALRLLVDQLREDDQVAIVVYGSEARTVLEHTGMAERERILAAIDGLTEEGSTNAEAGLRLGYQLAGRHLERDAINRVILLSDGVANVGETGPDGILAAIRDYAAQGIYLTTIGFGMGDYNDLLMEQLANDGDGTYAYVDTLNEARRVFVENLTGTLQVIARDAKVQVEFNPELVASYRLLGYENRAIADEDFRNDEVDAGEIGAGHSVTALYEIVPTDVTQGDMLTVQLRWENPDSGEVQEIAVPLAAGSVGGDFATMDPQYRLAVSVAGFAEILRGSPYAANDSLAAIEQQAAELAEALANDAEVQEFYRLVQRAVSIRG
jgi:Ca-activated chloride channel family protein